MSFALEIDSWADKSLKEVERLRKAIIFALFKSVINDTPVEQGRLRGNWQISSGKPKSGVLEVLDPGGEKTVKKVADFLEGGVINKDQATFLTNNLPYAYVVEYGGFSGPTAKVSSDGFSRKSPEGMVRKNFIRISNNLKKVT